MPKDTKQNKQLRRWAFVLNSNEHYALDNVDTQKQFKQDLEHHAHKWVFQLERGENEGRLHFQGRFSFSTAKRKAEVLKLFPQWNKGNALTVRIEHDEEASSFYAMKQNATYVAGPWSDKDKPPYIPRQVREIQQLLPWQQHIVDHANDWDTRTINVIIDDKGNIGKSTLVTYIGAHRIGKKIPFCNDYKDILRMVMNLPEQRLYLIDMPRAIAKDRLNQLYSAIETIKDGYAYDDRYHFQDKYFDCPNIWVFSNILPDTSLLSADRWRFWKVENNCLKGFFIGKDLPKDCATGAAL